MRARDRESARSPREWWAGEESNLYSRRRLIYSQLSSPPAQPTHVDRQPVRWVPRSTADFFSWSRRRDSNPEPAVYKTAALPIELRRRAQGHANAKTPGRPGMILAGPLAGQARPRREPRSTRPRTARPRAGRRQRLSLAGRTEPGSRLDLGRRAGSEPVCAARRWRRSAGRAAARPARLGALAGAASASADSGSASSAGGSAAPARRSVRRPARRRRLGSAGSGTPRRRPVRGRPDQRRSPPRWLDASYRRIEPATAALSESTRPRIGMRTTVSQRRRTAGPRPWPSLPTTIDHRTAKIGLAGGQRRLGVRADDPQAADVEVGQGLGQVLDRHEQEMLDRAGRGLDRRRGEGRLAVRRVDDAVDAGRLGGSQQRAEVLRDPRASRGPGRRAARCRSIARARMSSRPANCRRSVTRAIPWWPSKPASEVSVPPSTSTIGMRRLVACRTSFSSAWRRCGTTSRRMALRWAMNASSTGWRPATSSSSSPSRSRRRTDRRAAARRPGRGRLADGPPIDEAAGAGAGSRAVARPGRSRTAAAAPARPRLGSGGRRLRARVASGVRARGEPPASVGAAADGRRVGRRAAGGRGAGGVAARRGAGRIRGRAAAGSRRRRRPPGAGAAGPRAAGRGPPGAAAADPRADRTRGRADARSDRAAGAGSAVGPTLEIAGPRPCRSRGPPRPAGPGGRPVPRPVCGRPRAGRLPLRRRPGPAGAAVGGRRTEVDGRHLGPGRRRGRAARSRVRPAPPGADRRAGHRRGPAAEPSGPPSAWPLRTAAPSLARATADSPARPSSPARPARRVAGLVGPLGRGSSGLACRPSGAFRLRLVVDGQAVWRPQSAVFGRRDAARVTRRGASAGRRACLLPGSPARPGRLAVGRMRPSPVRLGRPPARRAASAVPAPALRLAAGAIARTRSRSRMKAMARRRVGRRERSRVDAPVELADQIEERGQRRRDVEVVVQRRLEGRLGRRPAAPAAWRRPGRRSGRPPGRPAARRADRSPSRPPAASPRRTRAPAR